VLISKHTTYIRTSSLSTHHRLATNQARRSFTIAEECSCGLDGLPGLSTARTVPQDRLLRDAHRSKYPRCQRRCRHSRSEHPRSSIVNARHESTRSASGFDRQGPCVPVHVLWLRCRSRRAMFRRNIELVVRLRSCRGKTKRIMGAKRVLLGNRLQLA